MEGNNKYQGEIRENQKLEKRKITEKTINETKPWFLENINKSTKLYPD